jgi:UDP-N-acetylmuramate--alanine ligase
MNALMAIGMNLEPQDAIAKAIVIQGYKRRFSYQIKKRIIKSILMIMHHHPTEINAVHQAVRELYPTKKCWQFFSNTYLVELMILGMICKSLSAFDEILLWIFILQENCLCWNNIRVVAKND